MYDLVPDSTFSFKRGGEKSSKKCASRPLCATTDSTGHASRCIVRSGVQRGSHPGPYVRPDRDHQRPGSIPREGKRVKTAQESARAAVGNDILFVPALGLLGAPAAELLRAAGPSGGQRTRACRGGLAFGPARVATPRRVSGGARRRTPAHAPPLLSARATTARCSTKPCVWGYRKASGPLTCTSIAHTRNPKGPRGRTGVPV